MAPSNRTRAEDERQRGDKLLNKRNYTEAIKAYTEAIKWNPDNPETYGSRAECYIKLKNFDRGLEDCNTGVKLDPSFSKGHLQKGMLLKEQRQFDKAMESFRKAIELDESNQEATNGYRECMVAMDNDPEKTRARALSDPAVRKILDDPEMKRILKEMQENPLEARKHLQNPDVAAKIQKLVQCGVIRFC
ncbi:stress-induced-phosphoprotein 1-like [Pollicipes pollicipes]|uniref:stress-induced-phosphoprotein 1-like n=1 Tax=Pollicipes pollicipes TaxID=41117 RepID=UPI0018850348|nr:stress-induced-phosphoprotein 1-like [Pollicipes pollicipes]XP_037072559.1 stress-induced-phosphoprotein 1-like [Pollicipes pollicipes]XP_037072560.1 stress-induced-phosphoprotein 1-like [Pollicipes pollicipes]XP_037072561.1 stress-induced-phosphoprotein 1-like [Pollicipes pollicipes]XP_037072562.1 stress-induced-phosphoprotein 1-like [Pollicipes pollicipes]